MISYRTILYIGIFLSISYQVISQEEIDLITLENKIVEVRIKSKDKNDSLSIRTINSATSIFGTWLNKDEYIIFKPLIPLVAGKQYLIYRYNKNTDSFSIEKKRQASPSVLAFYPSADSLPENLLKCYISFTHPMQEYNIYDFITVKDERGKTLKDIILPLKPALWNNDQTILTLWIDPGRVKRDLIRNKNLGIPFESGGNYSIEISSNWKGINGENLSANFKKQFYIKVRDERIPKTADWKITYPESETKQYLSIQFPESMDYRTTLEGITVFKDDIQITGKPSLKQMEKRWVFIPDSDWQKGQYLIKIDSNIEDNAGNNLIRPFDRDLYKERKQKDNTLPEIYFTIR